MFVFVRKNDRCKRCVTFPEEASRTFQQHHKYGQLSVMWSSFNPIKWTPRTQARAHTYTRVLHVCICAPCVRNRVNKFASSPRHALPYPFSMWGCQFSFLFFLPEIHMRVCSTICAQKSANVRSGPQEEKKRVKLRILNVIKAILI